MSVSLKKYRSTRTHNSMMRYMERRMMESIETRDIKGCSKRILFIYRDDDSLRR